MKVLIIWSGALVPAYQQFFLELAIHMQVRVLAPKQWKHGSIVFSGSESTAQKWPTDSNGSKNCEIIPTNYWPKESSKYWVPSLVFHLWSFRPQILYIMDEMDRLSFTLHATSAKILLPTVQIVSYSLQNLVRPSYYRWHHSLAIFINNRIVAKGIAASQEANEVMQTHGFRGLTHVIPLWGSENNFYAGEKIDKEQFRKNLKIASDDIVLLFCGGLVAAKGLLLLGQILSRFPHIRLVTAGQGPLQITLKENLGAQCIHLGGLTGENLRKFYQAGDYLILPSLTLEHWKEQVGRSLIEGILCGCIALGSDSGNIPALTLFPETTFIQGNSESLANMLSQLPLPNADAIRLAQRKNVEKHYTAKAVALETAKFMEKAK